MKGFLAALQFLTRISIKPDLIIDQATFGRSMIYFPIIGLLIGAILALVGLVGEEFLTPAVAAVLVVALEVVITGGLHLDGYMDTMDGLFSGRSRERILEIMKDSRVGAHSVIALFLLLALKIALVMELPNNLLAPTLFLMPMFGRLAQVMGAVAFPYVRQEGMGKLFKEYVGLGQLLPGILLALSAAWLAWDYFGLLLTFIMLAMIYLQGRYAAGKLGGLTGDVYGAMSEGTEVVFLLFIYLLSQRGFII